VTYGADQIPYFDGSRRVTDPHDPFMLSARFRHDRMLYGAPETVAAAAKRFSDRTNADELICRFQLPGLQHDSVVRSMERFATEVKPLLA
jgi:alkanesulfonate monooxygenase SsuD/methylene tetrahydromethanopterin reductase-like flavin-dependent oxidoreductase (luciferase family)